MHFTLLDRILEIQPGVSITAVKSLSLAEEYLQDHFPLFPVMPGVLMLEAMTQASAWLIRTTEDFAHSIVLLKEARNVKYNDFVQPGETLTVSAEIIKQEESLVTLKAKGAVDGVEAVSARLVLHRFNRPEGAKLGTLEEYTRRKMRQIFEMLCQGATVVAGPAPVEAS